MQNAWLLLSDIDDGNDEHDCLYTEGKKNQLVERLEPEEILTLAS
jgi:hypothetical protein